MADREHLRRMAKGILPLRGLLEAAIVACEPAPWQGCGWAVLTAGDFLFLLGKPDDEAIRYVSELLAGEHPPLWYPSDAWLQALPQLSCTFRQEARWCFDHDSQPQDDHLRSLLRGAPANVTYIPIEGAWFDWCRKQPWTLDFVSQFCQERFERDAVGVLLAVEGEIVSGASAYAAYPGGVEMQVETRSDRQGRGYALLASAAMILAAHARGMRVTWDAANQASRALALRLGYALTGEYAILIPVTADECT